MTSTRHTFYAFGGTAMLITLFFIFSTHKGRHEHPLPSVHSRDLGHRPLWWQRHVGALADPEPAQVVHVNGEAIDTNTDARSASLMSFEGRERLRAAKQRDLGARAFAKMREGQDFFTDYDVGAIDMKFPPIRSDDEFRYVNETTSPYFLRYVSNKPKIAIVPEFLSDEECDTLVEASRAKLFRSQVALTQGDKSGKNVNDVRTSSQTWLSIDQGPAKDVVERILHLTNWERKRSEMLQILRYEIGQKYDAHEDYFHPSRYGHQDSNRALTAYLYLSDVEEGGETQFPMADNKASPNNFNRCDRGLRFRPHKRTVVLFYGMTPDAQYDPSSLHGSCPVVHGTKWGGTLWLRIPTRDPK